MKKRKKLAKWIIEIIEELESNITRDYFLKKLMEKGKATPLGEKREKMGRVYNRVRSEPRYWMKIKNRVALEKEWGVFSNSERADIVPLYIQGKERTAKCYRCNGSLYSDLHYKCEVCGWLICPHDGACGCEFQGYDS